VLCTKAAARFSYALRAACRIVRHPLEGEKFRQGEILVAPSTDPGWTPLFLHAAGILMETGGYLSHGAIVAREYGTPAMVNIPDIVNQVSDGAPLFVDGDRASVEADHSQDFYFSKRGNRCQNASLSASGRSFPAINGSIMKPAITNGSRGWR